MTSHSSWAASNDLNLVSNLNVDQHRKRYCLLTATCIVCVIQTSVYILHHQKFTSSFFDSIRNLNG